MHTRAPVPGGARRRAVWTRAAGWGRVGPLGLLQGEDLGTGGCGRLGGAPPRAVAWCSRHCTRSARGLASFPSFFPSSHLTSWPAKSKGVQNADGSSRFIQASCAPISHSEPYAPSMSRAAVLQPPGGCRRLAGFSVRYVALLESRGFQSPGTGLARALHPTR